MSSNTEKKKTRSSESVRNPDATADSFPSTISLAELPTTNPGRLERSLNADSIDDEQIIPHSTILQEYVGEVQAQGPSIQPNSSSIIQNQKNKTRSFEPVRTPDATADSFPSTISLADLPTTNPGRLETSLNAQSIDDEQIIPHSTALEEYVGEIQAQGPPTQPNSSSVIQNQTLPTKITLTNPSGSHQDFHAWTSSFTNLGPLRPISSAPFQNSLQNDHNPTRKDDTISKSNSHPETNKPIATSSNAGTTSGKSSSEYDRAVVEDYSSDNLLDSFDRTMYAVNPMVPAPVDESVELKSIIERLHQEVQNSILQASTSVGNKDSSATRFRETFENGESYNSTNPTYIESDSNEFKKLKQRFTYKAPKNSQLQAKSHSSSEAVPTVNSSTSTNSTVAEVRVVPENTDESEVTQSRLASDSSNLSNSITRSVQTSGSEEVLSEMGMYQREVETWLRKVVAVVKEELETLYHNKAKHTRSTTHPESLLKKSSNKKNKSKKKFPYYPSGVIIPSCKSGKKKADQPKGISKRRMGFSEMFDSVTSTDERSLGDEDEGEYDEGDQFNYHPKERSGYSAPLNSDVSDKSNTNTTDEAIYDADYDDEYEEKQSELSLNSGGSQNTVNVNVRSSYVHQWIGNNIAPKDSNANEAIQDKAISGHKLNSIISNLQSSNLSVEIPATKSTKRTAGENKFSNSFPVQLSIETATQVYEEALRECKRDGEIFHQKLAERFTKMQITGLRRMAIQKRLHEADIRRAVLMDSKLTHLRSKSAKRMEKSLYLAKDKIETQNKACLTKMVEAKILETKGVLKLFKDTMKSERDTILEMKATQKTRTRKMYEEVNEQISKLENLLQRGTSDLDKISSKLRKTSSLDTIELLNSLHQKGYQQLQNEISKCISRICSSFLLQR